MPRTRGTLARRYRRLLLCYPRRYRQARGEEIVATLLELAPAGWTRPTVREAVNLVRHGLRCRLGRPNSRTVVLWAALTAIVWGLFSGAFATRLAWETARPLPTQAQATELFSHVLGKDLTGQVGVDPALFVIYGQPLGWHNLHLLFSPGDAGEYQQGSAGASLNGPLAVNHQDLVDSTRAWLRANGWQVSDVSNSDSADCIDCDPSTLTRNAVFAARRGDDVLNLEISLGDHQSSPPKPGVTGNDETYVHIQLTRARPAAVYPFGATGVLLGVVSGWLVIGWASRRTEGRARPLRLVTAFLFGVAIFLWCAPVVLAFPLTLRQQLGEPRPSWPPMWEWLGQPTLAPLFVVGTGAALLALAASALPRRAEPATDATAPSAMPQPGQPL
jgi:hypothetical protein